MLHSKESVEPTLVKNKSPDIEIHIDGARLAEILAWLEIHFSQVRSDVKDKQGTRIRNLLVGESNKDIQVLSIEFIADGFTSVWFASPNTPWSTDTGCAPAAFEHFNAEVRCSVSSWSADSTTDDWRSISNDGEAIIRWQS